MSTETVKDLIFYLIFFGLKYVILTSSSSTLPINVIVMTYLLCAIGVMNAS